MVEQILECVPNISEGRDHAVIDNIVASIQEVSGIKVLNVDAGFDANRTVITFAGEAEQVLKAAFNMISTATKLIDMRKQKGEHPRMGAVDVCPLIPVKNISMQEAVAYSRKLAQRVGEELHIPIFLYEFSQGFPYRKKLEDIRQGEYEGWAKKIWNPIWRPDYGPSMFDEITGCTVIGARNFLIAYNINLASKELTIAKRIAGKIRGSGHLSSTNDKSTRIPGRFPSLKAIGWEMPAYNCVQVSMNITDMETTPLHVVFEAVKEEAEKEGVSLNGSELIGMIPESVLLEAGKYYSGKTELSANDYIEVAVQALGLNSIKPFIPVAHILEWKLGIGNK